MEARETEDDVMAEIENFVNNRKNKKGMLAVGEDEDVYDMCDQMLEDLSYLDAQLE